MRGQKALKAADKQEKLSKRPITHMVAETESNGQVRRPHSKLDMQLDNSSGLRVILPIMLEGKYLQVFVLF